MTSILCRFIFGMARLVAVTIKKNGKIVKKKVVCDMFRYYLHLVAYNGAMIPEADILPLFAIFKSGFRCQCSGVRPQRIGVRWWAAESKTSGKTWKMKHRICILFSVICLLTPEH